MSPREVLWFEDVSPFNEPVFAFPVVGRLSMRQLAIIGIGFLVSYPWFQATGDIIAVAPSLVCMVFALKKQHVVPLEYLLFSVLLFYIKRYNAQMPRLRQFRIPKKRKDVKVQKSIKRKKLYVSDLSKPYRMKIRLQESGHPVSYEMAKVEFDGRVISTLSTDANGELEVIIIPETAGEKKIRVYSRRSPDPIFEETISFCLQE